jgi:hypothetical protein
LYPEHWLNAGRPERVTNKQTTYFWWNALPIFGFFGHVVLVEEPPAVTNIFSVPEPKIFGAASGSSTNTT